MLCEYCQTLGPRPTDFIVEPNGVPSDENSQDQYPSDDDVTLEESTMPAPNSSGKQERHEVDGLGNNDVFESEDCHGDSETRYEKYFPFGTLTEVHKRSAT